MWRQARYYTRSLNRPGKFLKAVAKNSRMHVKRPWQEAGSWFEVFQTIIRRDG